MGVREAYSARLSVGGPEGLGASPAAAAVMPAARALHIVPGHQDYHKLLCFLHGLDQGIVYQRYNETPVRAAQSRDPIGDFDRDPGSH